MDLITFFANAVMTALFFGLLIRVMRDDWEKAKGSRKKSKTRN
jgi:Pyruvate/2-oxoacid:ferredoxin oxidoreductase gamma subunit